MRFIQSNASEIAKLFSSVHNNKYDYSKASYNGASSKIEIICPLHGSFWQRPSHHLHRGQGCPQCSNLSKAHTRESFIKRAKYVHNNKYDYNSSKYNGSREKIEIICPSHGSFWQRPCDHLIGKGCKKCANEDHRKKYEVFLREALEIHGDKYDYSKVEWIKSSVHKIEIICPLHGSFWQIPHNHIFNKQGCPICACKDRTYDNDVFIQKAKYIHGDKYDYSSIRYTGTKIPLEIICPIHGIFWQIPNNHLTGQGCPGCSDASFKMDQPAILYYLDISNGQAYKIGITGRSVKKRYTKDDWCHIKILHEYHFNRGSDAYMIEQMILDRYSHLLYKGKPLLSSGNTELFKENIAPIIEYVIQKYLLCIN